LKVHMKKVAASRERKFLLDPDPKKKRNDSLPISEYKMRLEVKKLNKKYKEGRVETDDRQWIDMLRDPQPHKADDIEDKFYE